MSYKGTRLSKESIEKIRQSNLGQKRSMKTRKNISIAKKGISFINSGSFKKGNIPWNKNLKGIRLSPKSEFKKGNKPMNWKGGRINHKGYVYIHMPDHPRASSTGYILEHRLTMEKCLGRHLESHELVHHIDGNRKNNEITNLCLTDRKKHKIGYGQGYKDGYKRGFAEALMIFLIINKSKKEGR